MLTIFGSIALDTTRTPFRTESRIMGGAATYAAISASAFVPTSIVGVIGADFPEEYREILARRLDIRGMVLKRADKTFHYDSSFDFDLSRRTTNKTELNVIANFEPFIPDEYVESKYIYLANNDPIQNIKILEYFRDPYLVMCDTIEYWIQNKRDEVIRMFGRVDGVVINDEEARLLCKTANLIKCAKMIMSFGPRLAIIKKGEHGSLLVQDDLIFPAPAYPLEEIIDPTGAGDSFAGGFIGYLAQKKTSNIDSIKEALVYGNVMGAFAVEDFGVKRLLSITADDITSRYEKYRNLVKF
jgi:sugar/nucleoside kinase (ribokinase family)